MFLLDTTEHQWCAMKAEWNFKPLGNCVQLQFWTQFDQPVVILNILEKSSSIIWKKIGLCKFIPILKHEKIKQFLNRGTTAVRVMSCTALVLVLSPVDKWS